MQQCKNGSLFYCTCTRQLCVTLNIMYYCKQVLLYVFLNKSKYCKYVFFQVCTVLLKVFKYAQQVQYTSQHAAQSPNLPPPHDKPLNLVFQKNFLCSRHFFWNFCNSPVLVFINGPRYVRLQAGLYLCIMIVREDPLSIRAFIDICCTHTLNSTVLYCTVVNYMLINTNTG